MSPKGGSDIMTAVFVSGNTVKVHVYNICKEPGVSDRLGTLEGLRSNKPQ
jgi:DNA-binding CsgD family transcriptional regulator